MVLAACFQNFACGGLIFGWAAISSSLLIDSTTGPGLSRSKWTTRMTLGD